MNSETPETMQKALRRAGWPEHEFRSYRAALLFALDYIEQQQANGVSRASLHREFNEAGFACNFHTFTISLYRAKNDAKKASAQFEQPSGQQINRSQGLTKKEGEESKNKNNAAGNMQVKKPKGEIPGFVSSEKSNSDKLREQLI